MPSSEEISGAGASTGPVPAGPGDAAMGQGAGTSTPVGAVTANSVHDAAVED